MDDRHCSLNNTKCVANVVCERCGSKSKIIRLKIMIDEDVDAVVSVNGGRGKSSPHFCEYPKSHINIVILW